MRSGHLSEIFVSFQGEGAHVGCRHLFVRLAGCNLRCRYCDTPDSLERTSVCSIYDDEGRVEVVANPIDSRVLYEMLSRRLADDPMIDAISLTGGEPLLQADYLAEVLGHGELSVPVLLETNGMLPVQLRRLLDRIAIVSMDIKPPSNTGERAFWDEHAEFLRAARHKQTYIKVMVDAGTRVEEVSRAAGLVHQTTPEATLYLQPLVGQDGEVDISREHLSDLFRAAKQRTSAVRVVPQIHKILKIQ